MSASPSTASLPLLRIALVLGMLSAIGPFAIDMYLPALPEVGRDLGASEGDIAMTLTAYFIPFGLAQLVYGPLADAWGRKLPLMGGVMIFLIASLWAGFAQDLETLLMARALQGVGGAALVIPRAVIRDMASGPAAARMMSAIMVVTAVSPMLAPLTGAAVLLWGGWREIFFVLVVAALASLLLVIFALPETLPAAERRPVRGRELLEGAKRLLTSRSFMALTLLGGFSIASFFVYLAQASYIYTGHYGLTPTGFSFAFAANTIGFFSASQLAGRTAERFGMERAILGSLIGFSLTALALAGAITAGFDSFLLLSLGLLIANAFLGLTLPLAMVRSLDPHPDIAGLAASLGGALQMLIGGAMIALTGQLFAVTLQGMVWGIALCALLGLAAGTLMPRTRS